VLDHLHRCLTTWLAPVLCFTAEEAWDARFGDTGSVHLQLFPTLPASWRDPALAAKWERVREVRRLITGTIEVMRATGTIKSSLQANATIRVPSGEAPLLTQAEWAEVAIVSAVSFEPLADAFAAPVLSVARGSKCVRCWRVLEEVGQQPMHPLLCVRCADAVESGLVCRPAA
jgi:isoleucyl-tRNA synthetase